MFTFFMSANRRGVLGCAITARANGRSFVCGLASLCYTKAFLRMLLEPDSFVWLAWDSEWPLEFVGKSTKVRFVNYVTSSKTENGMATHGHHAWE